MNVTCDNCGETIEVWREPILQVTRPADAVGPAVHVISGDGWVLHRCFITKDDAPD